MDTVVFACVHAAGRSQMAAAFFNALSNRPHTRAIAAGTQPAPAVHPEVVMVMLEHGIDLRHQKSPQLTPDMIRDAALLVTMGCGAECSAARHAAREDWCLDDPHGKSLDE